MKDGCVCVCVRVMAWEWCSSTYIKKNRNKIRPKVKSNPRHDDTVGSKSPDLNHTLILIIYYTIAHLIVPFCLYPDVHTKLSSFFIFQSTEKVDCYIHTKKKSEKQNVKSQRTFL